VQRDVSELAKAVVREIIEFDSEAPEGLAFLASTTATGFGFPPSTEPAMSWNPRGPAGSTT